MTTERHPPDLKASGIEQNQDSPHEQALALGFTSVAEMRDHQRWLEKNGTAEFRRWLARVSTQSTRVESA